MAEVNQRVKRLPPILWLAAGVAIGICGTRLFDRETAGDQPSAGKPAKEVSASISPTPGVETNAVVTAEILSPLEKLRRLDVRTGVDLYDCLGAINELPAKDCRAALDLFRRFPEEERKVLQRAIARRWVALDPEGIFQAAWPPRDHWQILMEVVARDWAARDPEAALARLSKMSQPMERIVFARYILYGVAEKDPARAAAYLANEARSGMSPDTDLYAMVAGRWAHDHPADALAWASALPAGTARNEAVKAVLSSWSERDPASAAAYIAQAPQGRFGSQLFNSLSKAWSQTDPRATLAWIQGLSQKAEQDAAWLGFTLNLAKLGGDAGLELLSLIPAERRADVAAGAAYGLARQDPAAALAWAERLPEGTMRNRALQPVLEALARTEPLKAVSYVSSLPASEMRSQILSRAMRTWAGHDADAALAWTSQMPEGKERDRVAYDTGREFSEFDVDRAQQWLGLIQNSGTRQEFIGNLMEGWARLDGVAAAKWLATLPDANTQRQGHYSVGRQWAFTDAAATARWMESLPSGALRDEAIRGFVSTVDGSDPGLGTKWAVTMEDPQERQHATRDVFGRWLQSDPAAARAWLDAQVDLNAELRAELMRAAQPPSPR